MADEYPDERQYPPGYRPPVRKKRWYTKTWVWAVAGILVIVLLLAATGSLKVPSFGGGNVTETPQPAKLTKAQELAQYVVGQQTAGVSNEKIIEKMRLSGYTDEEINMSLMLADPVAQFILSELRNGSTKPQIVDALLQQGYTPEVIQKNFDVVEKSQATGWGTLKSNWWIIALVAVGGYLLYRYYGKEARDVTPKVYTLEECREYCEDKLNEKELDFWPCKEYRNRPELRQYRFCYQEPIYPEFNSHKPWGHQAGNPRYYLLAVGYDRELVDFRVTENDASATEFLYAIPRASESRAMPEYMRLRERSEVPAGVVEERIAKERAAMGEPYPQAYGGGFQRYPGRRRAAPLRRRWAPGPVGGYEEGGV